jgi:hypothetical protein
MPLYEIEHVCPISPSQQKSLAVAITKIHTQKFTTPSFIVNVRFKDTKAIPLFVAGEEVSVAVGVLLFLRILIDRRWDPVCTADTFHWRLSSVFRSNSDVCDEFQRKANFISAHVRHGPGRTMEHYADVCSALATAWGSIIGTAPELALRGIFVLGDIITGWEAGFSIPPAGEDKAWLKRNMSGFQKLADAGNPEFQGLMHKLQTRADLKEVLASWGLWL